MSDDTRVTLGKGRPTPKRSEAQKRRGGPVLPPPTNRREAAKRQRAQQAEDRKAGRDGDPTRMLRRDAGPVRALVRDVVDGRRNLAVVMLPVALVFVLAQLSGNATALSLGSRLFTLALLLVLGDLGATAVTLRMRIRAEFPGEPLRGHLGYGLLRSTVLRRLRMPTPRVRPARFLRR